MRYLPTAVAIVLLLCGCSSRESTRPVAEISQFKDVTAIAVTRLEANGRYHTTVIRNPVVIGDIVGAIVLNPRRVACACKLSCSARFQTKTTAVEMLFSEDSFILKNEKGNQTVDYMMPSNLYTRLMTIASQQTNAPASSSATDLKR